MPVRDLLEPPEPLNWLLKGYLPPVGQILLFGDPAVGKCLIAIDWAASIATGRAWCGHAVKQGPVIYLAGEGHFGIRRRLMAWATRNGCLEELRAAPLFVSSAGAALTDTKSVEVMVAAVDAIAEQMGAPALICIDTLHRNFGQGDENSAADIATFVRVCDALASRYEATILVVHHCGHGDKSRSRGSSAIRGAVDAEYMVEDRDGTRVLTNCKSKDAPKPPPVAFDLEQVSLPWRDAEGEPETSVVLVETQGVGTARKSSVTPGQRLAFVALLDAIDASGFPAPADIAETLADGATLVSLESWRREFYAGHMGDSLDAKKKAFQRARGDLARLNALGFRDDCYWVAPACGGNAELQGIVIGRSMLRGLREVRDAA